MITPASVRAMRGSSNANSAGIWPYIFVLPTFLVMGLITFYPIFFNVWMSFTNFQLANIRLENPPEFIGLANYIGILNNDIAVVKIADFSFWKHLFFNIWWAVSSVFTTLIAGILIAIVLNVEGLWFKKAYRVMFILPMVIPNLVVNTVWRNMFDPTSGAINLALMGIGGVFGLPREMFEINWLGSIEHPIGLLFPWQPMPVTYYAMLISNFWRGWPWVTVIATGALQSIPKELYEAASIDGATGPQKLWSITLPLLRPAMVPAAILSYNWTFNLLDIAYFLTGGQPFHETELLVSILFRLVNEQRLYGVAASFAVIVFIVSTIMFLLTNRITRATESYDS